MSPSAICLVLLLSAPGQAAPAKGNPTDSARAELPRLLSQLDGDQYDVRQRAAARLEELAAEPGLATFLASEFERVLVMPNTSLEVRKQLERLQRRLPKVSIPPEENVSGSQLDRLVSQLEDDSYGARLAATKRLEWLLNNPKLAYPIMWRLRRKMATDNVSTDARRSLEPIYEQARGVWLSSDPATWNLSPVSSAQITQWLDEVATGAPDAGAVAQRRVEAALRELRDVLARDAEVPRVRQALEARLAQKDLPPAGAARLRELWELTRPAMVAEYWEGRRHLNVQHLLIGVPSRSPGAERASHFERIDDRAARCVSGQNLSPGDYPVGVAIPHPKREGAMFHLVNLSTPRRRMAYAWQRRREESVRLAEISRRSLDRYLARKTALAERELELLEQFDAREVSRFAGAFFLAVDDQPWPAEKTGAAQARSSRHGAICALLAVEGTREAIPGLLKALEDKRFLPPTDSLPCPLGWIAAMAIALRDPWPDVDAWLAGLVGRSDRLVHGAAGGPELGATAAAILLRRHQQDTARFGLEPAAEETFKGLGLSGYRFATPEARQKVRQWWAERKKST